MSGVSEVMGELRRRAAEDFESSAVIEAREFLRATKRTLADGEGGCERLEEKLEAHLLKQGMPRTPITQCEMRVFKAETSFDHDFLKSLARADFWHFPIPLVIEARRHMLDGVVAYQLEARAIVKERNSGHPSMVIIDKTVPAADILNAGQVAYYLVRRLMLHEVDESFHFDDIRVYDPHAQDSV